MKPFIAETHRAVIAQLAFEQAARDLNRRRAGDRKARRGRAGR
jgi:hypothetical protein